MSGQFSYADAVKLLGGGDKKLVNALDSLTGGLLQASTGGAWQLISSLFDPKGELAKLNEKLIISLGDKIRGLGRFDRTARLVAAHKVIVLTSFFEAVKGTALPFKIDKANFDRTVQIKISTGKNAPNERLGTLTEILNERNLPGDFPSSAGVADGEELNGFYSNLSRGLIQYMEGLAEWDHSSETERQHFISTMLGQVPGMAVRRYEELLRRLAEQFPEVVFWVNRLDHSAIRTDLSRLQVGLEGLGRALERIASGKTPDRRRQAVARRYEKILNRPIISRGDGSEGPTIPTLSQAYINPRYRASHIISSDRIDQESWWETQPICEDLQDFLIRYLTSISAAETPLIVLGQPGSGKSVLTKVIAARLPARDYLAVRVELREVPADTDLQSQVEHAIREATGETLSWPDLALSADGAFPVILLDGFDELLQATGIGQTDYLEQIAAFQEREADQGRPVAVIITSRTAVADRARVPIAGATAVRLEPFDDEQIRLWLTIWNSSNAAYLERRSLKELPAGAVLGQPVLAAQPLLLLMLALYDSADNALQYDENGVTEADLYERILTSFAEREVRKIMPGLKDELLYDAVHEELLRLSIVAFAMFNRGLQWVTDEQLSADLTALIGKETVSRFSVSPNLAASPAQLLIGRFFFIHEAQAIRDGRRLTTCEFLHATFGEFLSARLIFRELSKLAAIGSMPSMQVDNGSFLQAIISFVPLTARGTVINFLAALSLKLDDNSRPTLRRLLLSEFHRAHETVNSGIYKQYNPTRPGMPARHAAYSANLLLLTALVGGGPVTGTELFPGARFPAVEWRRYAMLWRSQFNGEGWRNLAATLCLRRIWASGDRDVLISYEPWDAPNIDVFWTHRIAPDDGQRNWFGWQHISVSDIRRESFFVCDMVQDVIFHALEPVNLKLDKVDERAHRDYEATTAFGVLSPERLISATHALVALWVASSGPVSSDELQKAYRECLETIYRSRHPQEKLSRNDYYSRVLRQLAADHGRLPGSFRREMYKSFYLSMFASGDYLLDSLVGQWAHQAFGDLEEFHQGFAN